MNAFRSLRFWPVMALFALLCMATTPMTAFACACHMAMASSAPSAKVEIPRASVASKLHSCCHPASTTQAAVSTPVKVAAPAPPTPTKKSCCCHLSDQQGFIGAEQIAWTGWSAVSFAVLPPAPLVLGVYPQTTAFFRPVAQSPPLSPPGSTSRGRAPPVFSVSS